MFVIQEGSIDIFQVNEDITIRNVEVFQNKMKSFLIDAEQFLLLDLEHVEYLNSSALGIIAHTAMQSKQMDKKFVVAGIHPLLEEIFTIVKFSSFMRLFPTVEEGINYLSNDKSN
ncbi:STAS domain-containing protein [Cytobacillus sp. FJAT-54145]|uniref:STAS domain-containing protein n=1 Tax=Cytobacillus spartinae TaxID=3299023 RepID=A0ABW6KFZ1_9BACI